MLRAHSVLHGQGVDWGPPRPAQEQESSQGLKLLVSSRFRKQLLSLWAHAPGPFRPPGPRCLGQTCARAGVKPGFEATSFWSVQKATFGTMGWLLRAQSVKVFRPSETCAAGVKPGFEATTFWFVQKATFGTMGWLLRAHSALQVRLVLTLITVVASNSSVGSN